MLGPVSEGAVQTLAHSGVMLGTVPYMSPEQVESLPVDSRSDIFSLGVVLFEMLVGYRPFQGDSTIASTFALGIHWIADIVAGVAVGGLSVWFATKADARLAGPAAG